MPFLAGAAMILLSVTLPSLEWVYMHVRPKFVRQDMQECLGDSLDNEIIRRGPRLLQAPIVGSSICT